jgi:hypothetical protein
MTKRSAGALAHATGQLFQDGIANQLEAARMMGEIAWWEHNQPLFRPIGKGRFVAVARGGADFAGILPGGGIAFAIEAKSCDDDRFYRSWLPENQTSHLDAVARAGGLALLAIQFRGAPCSPSYLVEWFSVPWLTIRSAPSIGPADLVGSSMARGGFLLAPFLVRCPRCRRVTVAGADRRCAGCP